MLLPFFAPRFLLDAFTTRALRHTKTGSPPSSIFFCSLFHSSGAMILAGPSMDWIGLAFTVVHRNTSLG